MKLRKTIFLLIMHIFILMPFTTNAQIDYLAGWGFVCPGSEVEYWAPPLSPGCTYEKLMWKVTNGAILERKAQSTVVRWNSNIITGQIELDPIIMGSNCGVSGSLTPLDVVGIYLDGISIISQSPGLTSIYGSFDITAEIFGTAASAYPNPAIRWRILSVDDVIIIDSDKLPTGSNVAIDLSPFATELTAHIGTNMKIQSLFSVCGGNDSIFSAILTPTFPAPDNIYYTSTSPSCNCCSDAIITIDSVGYLNNTYKQSNPIPSDMPEMVFSLSKGVQTINLPPTKTFPISFDGTQVGIDIYYATDWEIAAYALLNNVDGSPKYQSVTMIEPTSTFSVTLTATPPDCYNGTGTLTADVSNGSDAINYTFIGPNINIEQTSNTLSVSSGDGDYTVNVTDDNNDRCGVISDMAPLKFPIEVVGSSTITSPIVCHDSTAIITASASGGTGTYNFLVTESTGASWSGSNPYVCYTGNYTITATDENGCSDDTVITISNPSPISITAQIDNQPANCNPEQGQVSMSASNVYIDNNPMAGVLYNLIELDEFDNETIVDNLYGYSPSWSETFTPSPGRYKIRASHSCNDTYVSEIFVIDPAIHPVIADTDTTITDAACFNGIGQVTLNSFNYNGQVNTSLNSAGFDYYINGIEVFTDGNFSYSLQQGTTGELVIQHESSLCESTPFDLFVNAPPLLEVTKSILPAQCHNTGNITLSANVSGGTGASTYTYRWKDANTNIYLPDNTQSVEVWEGAYELEVVDGNICGYGRTVPNIDPIPVPFTASRPQPLDLYIENGTDADAPGAENGSVNLGTTYTESLVAYSDDKQSFQPSPIFNNLAVGTHTFYITNEGNLCLDSVEVTIGEAEEFIVSQGNIINVSCYNGNDGQISINASGGFTPYTYSISGTGINRTQVDNNIFDNLPAGTYNATVSFTGVDTYNKTINNIEVTQPTLLQVSISDFTNAVCGQAQGSATVTATGGTPGYSYQWSGVNNSQTTQTASSLEAGIHSVIVTDANGCTAETSIQLSDPDGPILTQTGSTPVPCHNSTDGGSATLSVSGGTAPFDVYWPELDLHDSVAVNIAPGYYQASVTDATGCMYPLANISVPAPEELSAILTDFKDPTCFNDANGQITVAGNGGTTPYQYQWQNISDNPTTAAVSGLQAGSYEVLVTDANNCTVTESFDLLNPDEIIINLPDSTFICEGQTATLDAGNTGALFNWTSENGYTSDQQIINVQEQGDYEVQVNNVQGCSNSAKVHVKYENRQFYATFLMAGEATLEDTIIVIELSRPAPDSLKWYIPDDFMRLTDGDAYKELLPLEVGEYTVAMKAYYSGCSEMVEKSISIIPTNHSKTEKSLAEALIQNAKLFPNPNTGAFDVEVKLAKEADISADIFSMQGMRMMPTKYDYGKKEYLLGFNLMQLDPGIYFVNIMVGNEMRKLKFIVN